MTKSFTLLAALWLTLSAPVLAQTAPGGGASTTNPSGAPATTSSGNSQANPILGLHDMPCSVSLNATGGITTSSSCGIDPLAVPTQTMPTQASGSLPPPSGTSGAAVTGGTQTSRSAGAANSSTTQSASSAPSVGSGAGAPAASTTLCASTVPTTAGPTGAGSLIGGC